MSSSSNKKRDRIRTRSKKWGSERMLEIDASERSSKSSTSSSRKRWKIVAKKSAQELPLGYLGVCQRYIAEKKLGNLRFAVYHQLPNSPLLENMKCETTLACVFKSSRCNFTHFPIVEYVSEDENIEYYVDTGSSKPPKRFHSIQELIGNYCRLS